MKKIKIMLASIALIAVVGGALAFKAKFSSEYCTAAVSGTSCPATCPNHVTNSTTQGATAFVCTTTAPNVDCTFHDALGNHAITCNTSLKLITETP